MPKVSVLMPVYKTNETFLREAIESILNQTFQDFELLILDDYPEDDREHIVKSYKDNRIKYFKNDKNLGITPSRNRLIDLSQGEYLAVFDHDDISLPERLEKEVTYLDDNPKVGIVSSHIRLIPSGRESISPIENNDIKLALMQHDALPHTAAMIRKSVLTENNIRYEEQFSPAEDYALSCRLIGVTEMHNLPDILVLYRKHGNNTSIREKSKMESAVMRVRALMQKDYPLLYQEYSERATYTTHIGLLGIIPLLKIIKSQNKTTVYLFSKLPLLKLKESHRLGAKYRSVR